MAQHAHKTGVTTSLVTDILHCVGDAPCHKAVDEGVDLAAPPAEILTASQTQTNQAAPHSPERKSWLNLL
jgi:hypothetical protein